MVIEQEVKRLFQNLTTKSSSYITIGESQIYVSISDFGSVITLSTSVFEGGNYIPGSVRACIKKQPPFYSKMIATELLVSEEKFQITLHYKGPAQRIDRAMLKNILEEFAYLSDEWRLLLDEQDRNDHVHIVNR